MTTTKLTRRAALAGSVVLPLAPAAAMAKGANLHAYAEPANATDAAWAELQAANAATEALQAKSRAFNTAHEARLPAQLKEHTRPTIWDFDRHEDFKPVVEAWNAERASYGVNPYEEDGGPLERAYDRAADAQKALLAVRGTSATDLERKLSIMAELTEENMAETWWIESVLADVRRINGRAV